MSSVESLEKRVAELEESTKRYLHLTIIGIIATIVFAVMLWMVPSRNDIAIIGQVVMLQMRMNKLDPAGAVPGGMEASPAATPATTAP